MDRNFFLVRITLFTGRGSRWYLLQGTHGYRFTYLSGGEFSYFLLFVESELGIIVYKMAI